MIVAAFSILIAAILVYCIFAPCVLAKRADELDERIAHEKATREMWP